MEAALPKHQYVDEQAWLAEREAVLFGEWCCVGRLATLGLTEPSRVAVVDVVGESVLVTTDESGRLLRAPQAEIDDPDQFGPNPVGVEGWAGFVFVHLTPERAELLAPAVARAAETLAHYGLAVDGATASDVSAFAPDRPALTDPDYAAHWLA